MDLVNSVTGYININGCFIVMYWYKRGIIIDKIVVSKNGGRTGIVNNQNQMAVVQVDNDEVNFLFTHFVPNNSSFFP